MSRVYSGLVLCIVTRHDNKKVGQVLVCLCVVYVLMVVVYVWFLCSRWRIRDEHLHPPFSIPSPVCYHSFSLHTMREKRRALEHTFKMHKIQF